MRTMGAMGMDTKLHVIAGEGSPPTTCNAVTVEVVGGGPSPAMTRGGERTLC
jgi:hypothetical protein